MNILKKKTDRNNPGWLLHSPVFQSQRSILESPKSVGLFRTRKKNRKKCIYNQWSENLCQPWLCSFSWEALRVSLPTQNPCFSWGGGQGKQKPFLMKCSSTRYSPLRCQVCGAASSSLPPSLSSSLTLLLEPWIWPWSLSKPRNNRRVVKNQIVAP